MFISNSCILLSGWDVESLLQPHRSVPFNPAIANTFYRAGYIETWGRGIQKIYESCKELGVPAPEYSIVGEDITVKFTAHDSIYSDTVNGTVNLSDFEKDILTAISQNPNYTRKQICDVMAVSLLSPAAWLSIYTKSLLSNMFSTSFDCNRSFTFWVIPVGTLPHFLKRFQISTEYFAVCSSFRRR